MEVLAGVSQLTEVNLFLMNPCKEYWGDIVSDWELKRTKDRERSQAMTAEELHLEKGNGLLASMGTMGRDFFDLVNEFPCEEIALFEEPGQDNLLSCIQFDILTLRNGGTFAEGKRPVAESDDSVRIHVCHSPMREMEVLRDQLLGMFDQDPNLMPEDVLVLTPDIETYAPYVEAVFDVPADDADPFPYNLSDRGARKTSQILDAFLSILELCGSRFSASQVMNVLESRAVLNRFGLTEGDVETIRAWVSETGIRWGIDAENRTGLGLPSFSENTWKAGLQRLLLGYAMSGGEQMFGGILPFDRVEGSETLVLGKFIAFAETLFKGVTSLDRPRTLGGWSKKLLELTEGLFLPDETAEHEIEVLRRSVRNLEGMEASVPYHEEVDINLIKGYLGRYLEKKGLGFGFMAGGITFCAMLPMRSIPFKVVCLVGMNGDAYPRESRPLGFDLMAQHPRPGDRSRRNDDRYLFLETLLSAREKFYISYVGQSTRDNSSIPPSVLVSELIDYVGQGFEMPGSTVLDHMVSKHRLQPFSPVYFKKGEKIFSYSQNNMEAALASLERRDEQKPFVSGILPWPEDESKTVSLDDLCRFYKNPAKYFINRRFGMFFEVGAATLEDAEPFDIQALDKYVLDQALVERRFSGKSLIEYEDLIRAAGRLPHGAVGTCLYENMRHRVNRFVEKTEPFMATGGREPIEIDLALTDFRILGRLDDVTSERFVQYRYAKVTCKDRISLWIRHLALNCLMADDGPTTSMLIGLSGRGGQSEWAAWEYGPLDNSREYLERLLKIYRHGLCRPVFFFPESSWAYAQSLLEKGKSDEDALRGARRSWLGDDYHRGECDDAYYQCCFRGIDPLCDEFKKTATEIFGPLLASQKKVKR
jgi:exodeoxyribonuclease V gamma subunit